MYVRLGIVANYLKLKYYSKGEKNNGIYGQFKDHNG